jgi:hypothetical protein
VIDQLREWHALSGGLARVRRVAMGRRL